MKAPLRWTVAAIVVAHGLLHLLGTVKGFGSAEVTILKEPIRGAIGAVWLAAAALLVATGVLLASNLECGGLWAPSLWSYPKG